MPGIFSFHPDLTFFSRRSTCNLSANGSGGLAQTFETYTRFRKVADTANFILITPDGLTFPPPYNWTGWNNYTGVNNGPDDVLFVSDMIDKLKTLYQIDTTRIYSSGWSNGGFMGFHLAWQLSNRIAAVASVSGSMQDSMFWKLSPSRAVPIIEIHGTNDGVVPYGGGPNTGLYIMPVDSVLNFWVNYNHCNPTPTVTDVPDINTTDGSTVKRYVWEGGTDGATVELLKIDNGGHTWPDWTLTAAGTNRDIAAHVEIWRFFLKHSLKTSVGTETPQQASEQAPFSVSPNPASDLLTVSFSEKNWPNAPTELRALNLSGQIMLRKTLTDNELSNPVSLRIENLPAGIYFLSAVAEGRVVGVRRFVAGL